MAQRLSLSLSFMTVSFSISLMLANLACKQAALEGKHGLALALSAAHLVQHKFQKHIRYFTKILWGTPWKTRDGCVCTHGETT